MARAMVTAMRVPVNEEGEGGMGHGVEDEGGMRQRGQWRWRQEQWQQGWRASEVACDEEGNGDGYKSDGNEGDGQAMGTRAMVTAMATVKATTWLMVMVTRLAGNKEGKGKGGKGDGDDNEGGARAMERARVAR